MTLPADIQRRERRIVHRVLWKKPLKLVVIQVAVWKMKIDEAKRWNRQMLEFGVHLEQTRR